MWDNFMWWLPGPAELILFVLIPLLLITLIIVCQKKTRKSSEIHAGFCKRFIAHWIDVAVIVVGGSGIWIVLFIILDLVFVENPSLQERYFSIAGFIFIGLYYCLMESYKTQGTLGKMALRIKVEDDTGSRISFIRAVMRYILGYISAMIFGIGYLMIIFTRNKQGFHDIVTDCYIVNK